MKTDRPRLARFGALLAALVLAACGADTKTGSNGTGAQPQSAPFVTSGTLVSAGPFATGSESLQTGAAMFRVDESADAEGASLRLGMSFEAAGRTSESAGPAVADVSFAATQSTARGPASAIDAGAGRFNVATLTFITDINTLYDGVAGLAALAPGDSVEVHGMPLADLHTLLATRVTRVPAAANGFITLAGRIEAYTGNGISVVGLTIAAPALSPSPPLGVRVRVTGALDLQAATIANPQIGGVTLYPATANGRVEFEGIALDSAAAGSSFRLRTPARDYAVAAGPNVMVAVTAGARVRVVGTAASEGALVSESVTVITAPITYRVSGAVTNFSSLQSLRVRGEPVDLTLAVIRGGSASDIGNGKRLQVIGTAGPGALRVTEATILP